MTTDLERRTTAALSELAATVAPHRPTLDALLHRPVAPLSAGPRRRPTVRWAGAAAALVVVLALGALVSVMQRRSPSPERTPPIGEVTSAPPVPTTTMLDRSTTAPGPKTTAVSTFFVPTAVPDGFDLIDVDAWTGADGPPVPVSTETWIARDASEQIIDMIRLSASLVPVEAFPSSSPPAALTIHGHPATDIGMAYGRGSGIGWTEQGLFLSVVRWGPDASSVAELATVDGTTGISLPADAAPVGFVRIDTQPGSSVDQALSSTLIYGTDDPTERLSLTVVPNAHGETDDSLGYLAGLRRVAAGEHEVWLSPSGTGFQTATWVAGGAVLRVSGSLDEAALIQFVAGIEPISAGDFEALRLDASERAAALPERDRATFSDGIAVSLGSAMEITSTGDFELATSLAICLDGDRLRCVTADGSTGGGDLLTVRSLQNIGGEREYVAWIATGLTVSRIYDPATGADLRFESVAGRIGAFVRVQVPAASSRAVAVAYTDDSVPDAVSTSVEELTRTPQLVRVDAPTTLHAPSTHGG
jgi:hypothetical protein